MCLFGRFVSVHKSAAKDVVYIAVHDYFLKRTVAIANKGGRNLANQCTGVCFYLPVSLLLAHAWLVVSNAAGASARSTNYFIV